MIVEADDTASALSAGLRNAKAVYSSALLTADTAKSNSTKSTCRSAAFLKMRRLGRSDC